MRTIDLTQGQVALVDDEDYEYLNQFNWCYYRTGYAGRSSKISLGKRYVILMHRQIMNTPDGMDTDHINHNKLDNRKENLRVCTGAENLCNRYKWEGKKYKGVYIEYGKYIFASITKNRKQIRLGSFPTLEDAARAYDKAAKEIHGKFALLNFPEDT